MNILVNMVIWVAFVVMGVYVLEVIALYNNF
jgi:hypothetical protein